MRTLRSRNEKSTPETIPADRGKSRRSFEWPLLIYPVLFVATLAVLYVVQRSIETESPTPVRTPQVVQTRTDAPNRGGQPDRATGVATKNPGKLAAGPASHVPPAAGAGANGKPGWMSPANDGAGTGGRVSSAVGKKRPAVDPNQLKGPARTVAILCVAVEEKDHARIKQCLVELVAMGDQAVIPLHDLLVTEQGETALWAAMALARIGTPTAASALLDRLAQTKEGTYKEELGKRASDIRNHDSWPLLLETMMQTGDSTVVRAAGASLSLMADAPILDEVIARYGTASTETELERLTQLVRGIRSPQAAESLRALAGPASLPPQDSLQEAAIEALAKVGDAPSVNHLLQRLEASPPGEAGRIFNAITQIDSPEAQASLLYAAAGNKEVSAEHGRTAAIYALKNYPDEKTVALLERIVAQEHNEKVLTAATRTLDDIKRSPHAVAAKADALQRSEQMLPLTPLEK